MEQQLDLSKFKTLQTVQPYNSVSDKYKFISTMNIIDMLDGHGWSPFKVQESRCNKTDKTGFQRHMVRFNHPDYQLDGEDINVVLFNGHDGLSAFRFFIGVYRAICANGLIVGQGFGEIKHKHIGLNDDDVIDAVYHIKDVAPKIADNVSKYKQIELSIPEQHVFAKAVTTLIEDDTHKVVNIDSIIRPKRISDADPSLWNTFNVVQENVIKGGFKIMNTETHKQRRTKGVTNIQRDIALNRAIWTLADEMAKLKKAA